MIFHTKNYLPIYLCSALLACQTAPTQDKTSVPITNDSVKQSMQKDSLTDPDLTDTIPASFYGPDTYRPEAVRTVQKFTQQQYAQDLQAGIIDSASKKFQLFEYDLNDDGIKEIFVALNGPYFCGSGGCSFLLLDATGKLITSFTVTEAPFVVLPEKKNGYHNLMVYSDKAWRVLSFDGKKYPSNPSVAPKSPQIPGDGLPRILHTEAEPFPSFYF